MTVVNTEKSQPQEVEVASTYETTALNSQGDYSGAIAKSDEVEIALVKKLDRRILPMLWAMYFLYA